MPPTTDPPAGAARLAALAAVLLVGTHPGLAATAGAGPAAAAAAGGTSSAPGSAVDAGPAPLRATADTVPIRPPGPWRQLADPARAGFDAAALRAVCGRADSLRSGALFAVWRGRVIVACGAIDREYRAHSVRKSLVSGLYGTAVARGEVGLAATIGELGIGEDGGLTAAEEAATVRDLLTARSGVYLPAAYAPGSQERERPERGSHPPGTHWFYNNWDFNVAGVVYERATGEGLFASFERRIAGPLGMEDWSPGDGFRAYEPTKSRHPAHLFRISARDLARFGQLYLQRGRWDGERLIPEAWIEESTRPVSTTGDGAAYGYMWWVHPEGSLDPGAYPTLARHPLYLARGSGGQGLWVVPGLELVVVHRGDTDRGRGVDGPDAWALVERVAAARTGPADGELPLVPVDPVPLATQAPPAEVPEYRALPDSVIEDYRGSYRMAPEAEIRVFLFRGRPYLHVPGEGDALLMPAGEDRFTLRVVSGVTIVFGRDDEGRVDEVVLRLGPDTIRAPRIR